MKLPKNLLAAIVVGITVQTLVISCSKDDSPVPPKPNQPPTEIPKYPDNCPACGLG